MSILQGILLGLVQGLTEFLPVSSTGHLIIVRELFGLHDISALFFDTVIQVATLLAVVLYFRHDIWGLIRTLSKYLVRQPLEEGEKAFLGAIIMGTIPALIIGFLFENVIATSARSTFVVAWGLILGSILMFFAERHIAKAPAVMAPKLGWKLGWFQALALFPGISRSGSVISGGLFSGLTRADATRFAFVLSFPILLGAGGVSALELSHQPFIGTMAMPLVAAFITALGAGLLAIHFLLKFVRTRTLHPFIWYRLVLATLLLLFPF